MRCLMTLRPWRDAFVLLCLGASVTAAGDVSAERKAELRSLVRQDCGSCHGMTLQGGLGSALTPADLDGVDPSTIAQIVLDGVPGKPMPPWRGLLSEPDALWIAQALKAGVIK